MTGIEWKVLRIKARLTQHEAGQIVGLPSYAISALETDRRTVQPDTADQLQRALEARMAT